MHRRHEVAALVLTVSLSISACSGDSPTAPAAGGSNAPAAPTPVQITFDYSACTAQNRPLWAAFQDGTGAWTPVVSLNGVYSVSLTGTKGGFAFVTGSTSKYVSILHLTREEFVANSFVSCASSLANTKTVFAQVAGLAQFNHASLALGSGSGFAAANGTATISFVQPGTHDLLAYLTSNAGPDSDRILIRRDLNVAAGASLGTIDFQGAEAVAPATATVTVNGLLPGETASHQTVFYFGAACVYATGPSGEFGAASAGSATQPIRGIPASLLKPTDRHSITVSTRTISGTGMTTDGRYHEETSGALGNRTVTLPPPLETPVITALAGPYRRLQVSLPIATEFRFVSFDQYQANAAGFSMTVSTAWLGNNGSSPVTIATPDFSQVAGWNAAWAAASQSQSNTSVVATNTNRSSKSVFCADGGFTRQSVVYRTYP